MSYEIVLYHLAAGSAGCAKIHDINPFAALACRYLRATLIIVMRKKSTPLKKEAIVPKGHYFGSLFFWVCIISTAIVAEIKIVSVYTTKT